MALFRLVFSCGGIRIGWRASYQITMAGAVATKIFAAGGAGGVALTLWALRAAGLKTRALARRMTSFEILLYTVFMGSLLVFGLGLFTGLFAGRAPLTLTALPAAFGAAVIALALAMKAVPDDIERRLSRLAHRSHRARGLLARLATIPRTLQEGITTALETNESPVVMADPPHGSRPRRKTRPPPPQPRSTSARSGSDFERSEHRLRSRWWSWLTSSGSWRMQSRSRAGSAASKAG